MCHWSTSGEMLTLLLGTVYISTESHQCLLNKRSSLFFGRKKKERKKRSFKKQNNRVLTLPVKIGNCLFSDGLFSLTSNVNWWPQKGLWTVENKQPHERGSHLWSGQAPLTWSHHFTIFLEKKRPGLFKGPDSQPWTLDCCFFWTATIHLWYFSAFRVF